LTLVDSSVIARRKAPKQSQKQAYGDLQEIASLRSQ
jgi:hypothetical protein